MNKIIKLGILLIILGIWGCKQKTSSKKMQEDIVILEKNLIDTVGTNTNIFDNISDEPKGSVPNKIIGGREYFYQNPRFRYNDPSQKWYIYERPKGIHTYRYLNNDERAPKQINAFKIEFYDNSDELIKTIDLLKSNPFVDKGNSKYLGAGRPGFLERSYSNLASNKDIDLLQECHEYYTVASVWESSDDYVIIDYSMVGRDQKHRYIGEEHTLVIVDNQGDEIGRVDKLYEWVRSGVLSKDKKLLFFLQGDYRNIFHDAIVIYNVKKNKPIYKYSTSDETYGLINKVYEQNDTCLYVIGVQKRQKLENDSCFISSKYIDINNHQIITTCTSKDYFLSRKWPDGHFEIINRFFTNKEKF